MSTTSKQRHTHPVDSVASIGASQDSQKWRSRSERSSTGLRRQLQSVVASGRNSIQACPAEISTLSLTSSPISMGKRQDAQVSRNGNWREIDQRKKNGRYAVCHGRRKDLKPLSVTSISCSACSPSVAALHLSSWSLLLFQTYLRKEPQYVIGTCQTVEQDGSCATSLKSADVMMC